MSYLVIARKYRPMVFEDVVGQEHVTTTLKNAIESKRIAHAYIFSGPRGVGKTSSARILAKALNCQNGGPTLTPCNECTSCVEITSGRSMDVLEIDGASNRGIDEIRNLRDNVRYLPVHGGYRIYIIDEFHMITKDAFNALLKTLEEPPPQVVFIFATTEPHRIIPTILSRCQRFDFKRVPIEKIKTRLESICDAENIQSDQESLFAMAQLADGGMRDALTLLDQVVSFCGTTIRIEDVRKGLGIIGQEAYLDLIEMLAGHDTKSIFEFSVRITEAGWDLTEFLHGLLENLRNMVLAKSCGAQALTDTFEGYRQRFVTSGEKFSETDLLRMMSLVADTLQRIKWSVRQRVQFELLLLKLAKMDSAVTLGDLLQKMGNLEEGNDIDASKPVEKKKPELKTTGLGNTVQDLKTVVPIHTPTSTPIIEFGDVCPKWDEFVIRVKSEKIRLGAILEHVYPRGLEKEVLRVGFDQDNLSDIHADMLHKERDYLAGVAFEVFQHRLRLQCDLSPDVGVSSITTSSQGQGDQDNLFDHYPVVHASESPSTDSGSANTTELFTHVRQLLEEEPLRSVISALDAELISVEPTRLA